MSEIVIAPKKLYITLDLEFSFFVKYICQFHMKKSPELFECVALFERKTRKVIKLESEQN